MSAIPERVGAGLPQAVRPEAVPLVGAALTFDDLLAQYYADVFRFLRRLSSRAHDAEDLCQETFLRAYRAFDRLGPDPNYRAWLYRIAYNLWIGGRRRERPSVPLPDDEGPAQEGGADERELVRAVALFVRLLPAKQRVALVLRRVEGREYAEVAAVLGCSEESARANVFQALRKLRQRFGEEYEQL